MATDANPQPGDIAAMAATFAEGMRYADARQAAGIGDNMGGAVELVSPVVWQPWIPADPSAPDGVT